MALFTPVCLLSGSSVPLGHQSNHEGQMLGHASGPDLSEPVLVPKYGAAADNSPFASSAKEGPLFPSRRDNLASPTRVVESPSVAPRQEPSCLSWSVMNAISDCM